MSIVDSLFSWFTLSILAAGALLGAAVASLTWSRRARQARQDFSFSMRKRAAQTEKLRDQFGELQERLRRQDDDLAELAAARRDLASHRVELEQTRATLDDVQRALEAARADANDAESRFATQLESERIDSAARRHNVESELAGARDALLTMQDEGAASRAAALRTIERLETDLDATRAMLHEASEALRAEREAASGMRDELRAQIGAADWERQRVDAELSEERRQWAEKLSAVQPYIATMREQYLLAVAERDAITRELILQRERGEESARALEHSRAEFALALEEEHRAAMALLNRAWSYVQTFPRVPDSWEQPNAGPPAQAEHSRADARHRPDTAGESADRETPIEVERAADRVAAAPLHRSAPTPPPSPAAEEPLPEYDIEAELADAIGDDLDARSFARTRKTRKPVGMMKVGSETVVVCDDGSTWRKSDRGWRQVTPLPGTPAQVREPRIERAG